MNEDRQSDARSSLIAGGQSPAEPLSSQSMSVGDSSGIMLQRKPGQVSPKDQEGRLKFSEDTHQYVREQIRLADQKATFFFAGSTAFMAYLHKAGYASKWLVCPTTWTPTNIFSFLASIGLLLCAMACLWTVMPRLDGSRRGLIFFAAISEYKRSSDYVDEFMRQDLFDLCEAKLKHTHELSVICNRKYEVLRLGQWLGGVGLTASLLLLILL